MEILLLPPKLCRLLVPKPPPKPPPKLFPLWDTETELKPGRQPGRRLAEEALKFRVPPDLMVTEDRWVMVEAGVKRQQSKGKSEEPLDSGLPGLTLSFIPFKNWVWPE